MVSGIEFSTQYLECVKSQLSIFLLTMVYVRGQEAQRNTENKQLLDIMTLFSVPIERLGIFLVLSDCPSPIVINRMA